MENKQLIEEFIDDLKNKKGRFLFFVVDSKGKPMASITHAYEQVKTLIELGYPASLLVDSTTEYQGAEWLGEEYKGLPVINIKQEKFSVRSSDFIFIPEVFPKIMEATKDFPCKKIVSLHNYEYALEMLEFGKRWSDYNFNDVMVTNNNMADFAKSLFPTIQTHVVPNAISKEFVNKDMLRKPIVLIGSRDSAEATRFVKTFYLQYPHLQWFTFKMISDMSKEDLANELNESCGVVWIDKISSFGTIPLEAMATKTPVIGIIPNIIPEWLIESSNENIAEGNSEYIRSNGVWVNNILELSTVLSDYLNLWLEDNGDILINQEHVDKAVVAYSKENQTKAIEEVYGKLYDDRIKEIEKVLFKYGK